MDGNCPYPAGLEVLHLVFHEGNERGYHNGNPLLHHCRHLEAHGLAATRGKDCKDVPPCGGLIHNLFLHGAETCVSPVFLQNLKCSHSIQIY